MVKETVEPFTGLVSIIDEMQRKLYAYSCTENPKNSYIDKQQALINSLREIADNMKFYSMHPCWTLLQQYMDDARKTDSSIESFQVNLNLKPVTNRISIIDINLF